MQEKTSKYERAQKRVKDIKGFYSHLLVYILAGIVIQLWYSGFFDGGRFSAVPLWIRFISPGAWGIGLLLHGLWVFKGLGVKNLFKDWEERKIKEIMQKREEESKFWK